MGTPDTGDEIDQGKLRVRILGDIGYAEIVR